MNRILTLLAVAVLVGAGWWYLSQNRTTTPTPSPTPTPTTATESGTTSETMREIKINMDVVLEGANSGESGTATLKEAGGKTIVVLDLDPRETPKGVTQPAHIHEGSCPGVGAIKYPLTPVMDGKSETTLDVGLDQLLSEIPLAINVHKSVAEAKVYVSCGDIPTQ